MKYIEQKRSGHAGPFYLLFTFHRLYRFLKNLWRQFADVNKNLPRCRQRKNKNRINAVTQRHPAASRRNCFKRQRCLEIAGRVIAKEDHLCKK